MSDRFEGASQDKRPSVHDEILSALVGLPGPSSHFPVRLQHHRFDRTSRRVARPVLNGLHHEYTSPPICIRQPEFLRSTKVGPAQTHDTAYYFFAPGQGVVAMISQEDATAFWIIHIDTSSGKVLASHGTSTAAN